MTKYQKTFNLSREAVEIYLPALREAFGTYSTAMDVALTRLYERVVAEAVGIDVRMEEVEKAVLEIVREPPAGIEWRYAPQQSFDELPAWTYVRYRSLSRRDKALHDFGLAGIEGQPEDVGYASYVVLRTKDLFETQ